MTTTWGQTAGEGDTVLPARATCMDRCSSLGLHPLSTGQRSSCCVCPVTPSIAIGGYGFYVHLGPLGWVLNSCLGSLRPHVAVTYVFKTYRCRVCVLKTCRSRVTSWSRVRVGDVSCVLLMRFGVFDVSVKYGCSTVTSCKCIACRLVRFGFSCVLVT